jgi:hypothetical protein
MKVKYSTIASPYVVVPEDMVWVIEKDLHESEVAAQNQPQSILEPVISNGTMLI